MQQAVLWDRYGSSPEFVHGLRPKKKSEWQRFLRLAKMVMYAI